MSSTEQSPRVVEAVEELPAIFELQQMLTYCLVAERGTNDIEAMSDARQELTAQARVEPNLIETRFRLVLEAPSARYMADIGGIFTSVEPVELSKDLVGQFMSQIGLFAVFPYLREAVSGLAARLGAEPPVIGLIRRNQYELSLDDSTPED